MEMGSVHFVLVGGFTYLLMNFKANCNFVVHNKGLTKFSLH